MRWIFVSLLVVNVVFFVWASPRMDSPPSDGDNSSIRINAGEQIGVSASVVGGQPGSESFSEALDPLVAVDRQQLASDHSRNRCWRVNGLAEVVTAKQVMNRFQQHGFSARMLSEEREGEPGFELFNGPFDTLDAGESWLKEVQLAGLASASMAKSPDGHIVTLDHFDDEESALEAQKKYAKRGITVAIREQRSRIVELVVLVDLKSDEQIPIQFWQELDSDFFRLERQKKWCGAIASL